MTISTLNMIRTSGKRLTQCQFVGLCVLAAGCQTGIAVDLAPAPAATSLTTLETAVEDTFPGFTPWQSDQSKTKSNLEISSGHVEGDFNGDSLIDKALLLSKPLEWKLAVFFQESAGNYTAKEITTFPGKDSEWKAIPTQKLHLYPVGDSELTADRLGFEVAGASARLEYTWHENTQNFSVSRIRDIASIENQQETESVDERVVTLFAQAPKREKDLASHLDIDNQSTGDKPGVDLLFTSGAGSMRFYTLKPLGEAQAMPFGKSKPSYDDCRTQQNAMSNGSLPEIELGMHFCVKTDQGYISRVWIQGLDLDVHSITLGYQVWIGEH